MDAFSHMDEDGQARMVDVGDKDDSLRLARAAARVDMSAATLELLEQQALPKGDVLSVARIAGIMAAKETSRLIPLCHPLNLTHVAVSFRFDRERPGVEIESSASLTDKTGVEMEALTAVAVAALTIYDMCKAVDKGMVIGEIRLLEKRGGRSR